MKGMEEYSVVGKRLPLIDANEKVMGRALFTGDMQLPGMLHAAILRSPYAHARVLHVDTGQAERLAGVKAVLSKNNAPRAKIPATLGGPKERMAFEEKVRYVGDEVAAVVAINKEAAEEAHPQVAPKEAQPEVIIQPIAEQAQSAQEASAAAETEAENTENTENKEA